MPKDKVVIVTGAGSGIGRATALRFAQREARVAVVDRDVNRRESDLMTTKRKTPRPTSTPPAPVCSARTMCPQKEV